VHNIFQFSPCSINVYTEEQQASAEWRSLSSVWDLSPCQAPSSLDDRSASEDFHPLQQGVSHYYRLPLPPGLAAELRLSWLECFVGHRSQPVLCYQGTGLVCSYRAAGGAGAVPLVSEVTGFQPSSPWSLHFLWY